MLHSNTDVLQEVLVKKSKVNKNFTEKVHVLHSNTKPCKKFSEEEHSNTEALNTEDLQEVFCLK